MVERLRAPSRRAVVPAPRARPLPAPAPARPRPAPRAPSGPVLRVPSARFRPELEGLRALAATLVVVYHVWFGRVSGGVDVFFLVSGFLLVGQLTRAADGGAVDLVAQWGRTLRRLVPTTAVVLVASGLAGVWILPPSRWMQTIDELVASAFFVQNWHLAASSADYYAAHDRASIVQHLWSLSLQGQVALVLPLVVAGLVPLARRIGLSVPQAVATALVVLTAGSFAWSVVLTAADQPLAYFHSGTRLWEFTLGGLLALVVERIVLTRTERLVLGWAGVLVLGGCGIALGAGSAFPGWLALWPVLAGVAVLVAGRTGHPWAVDRVLVTRGVQQLGALSFTLYLWHWPVLTLGLALTGRPAFGLVEGLVVVTVSLGLALATHHGVELPVMGSSIGRHARRGEYRFVAVTLVPVLLLAAAWTLAARTQEQEAAPAPVLGDPAHPGAMVLVPGFLDRGDPATPPAPSPVAASSDWSDDGVCRPMGAGDGRICSPPGPAPLAPRLVVVGDSHMRQLVPALMDGQAAGRWQVTLIFRSACAFSLDPDLVTSDPGCAERNRLALEEIARLRPAAVVAQGTRDVRSGLGERTPAGFVAAWQAVSALGIPVVAVRDNPRFDVSPVECVEQGPSDACRLPRAAFYGEPPYRRAAGVPGSVSFLDLSDVYCPGDSCPAVTGRVLVYLDDNHVTASFSRTMGPVVTDRVAALLR